MKLALLFITFLLGISFNSLAGDDTVSVPPAQMQAGAPCTERGGKCTGDPKSSKPAVPENPAKSVVCQGQVPALDSESSNDFQHENCGSKPSSHSAPTPAGGK